MCQTPTAELPSQPTVIEVENYPNAGQVPRHNPVIHMVQMKNGQFHGILGTNSSTRMLQYQQLYPNLAMNFEKIQAIPSQPTVIEVETLVAHCNV